MAKQSNVGNPYGLTRQQLAFCDAYRIDPSQNQSAAYRHAYPRCKSVAAAAVNASRLLRKAKVQRYLHNCALRVTRQVDIKHGDVLREISRIAFFDILNLFDANGNILPVNEWPEGAGACVSAVEVAGSGEDEDATKATKVRLWDKGKQLDNLVKILGMVERDSENDAIDLLSQMYQRIKPTRGLPSERHVSR
jgi:phage terminase small subunit